MGNCAVYKPCDTAISAGYVLYQLLQEAGMPDGMFSRFLIIATVATVALSFLSSLPLFKI